MVPNSSPTTGVLPGVLHQFICAVEGGRLHGHKHLLDTSLYPRPCIVISGGRSIAEDFSLKL
jgi:hypothetical protein